MWKNRFWCLINGLHFSNEHSKNIIFATAVLHNTCTLCNDFDSEYFDGSDVSKFGFPASFPTEFNKKYPLDKIVCPRKKTSNGAMTLSDGCACFATPLIDIAPAALTSRHPNLGDDMKSPYSSVT